MKQRLIMQGTALLVILAFSMGGCIVVKDDRGLHKGHHKHHYKDKKQK